MPKYTHGSSTIYRREKIGPDGTKQVLKIWWLDYYHQGKCVRESSGTTERACVSLGVSSKREIDQRFSGGVE